MKHSISLAVRDDVRPGTVLLVRRPDDDEDLPGVWGLPAASLKPGEDWRDAALRAGREKLGVELDITRVINSGTRERSGYTLHMQLVAARIAAGTPDVRTAPVPAGSTRYSDWRWGSAADVRPAAELGSLCSRLLLEVEPDRVQGASGAHPAYLSGS